MFENKDKIRKIIIPNLHLKQQQINNDHGRNSAYLNS
jgi:hypothetical protein